MTESEKPQSKPSLPSSIEEGIGIRLKAAREAKSLSQSDLHNRTGLSRTVLINYEAGRHKPGTRELRLLCDALGVSPNYLIYGSEEPHAKTGGFADTLLSMGAGAVVPMMTIIPFIPVILGKDDTRAILMMIESLLKAKSPEGFAEIMKLVQVCDTICRDPAMIDVTKASKLFPEGSEAQQEILRMGEQFQQIKEFQEKLKAT